MTQPHPAPADHHRVLQEALAQCKKDEIVASIYTDGAGHADGFAGSAAIAIIPSQAKYLTAISAETSSSVDRAEFVALLLGLRLVVEGLKWDRRDIEWNRERRPVVVWFTDRESLALSVGINPATERSFYGRKNCPDLWPTFAYYEAFLRVMPVHRERNTVAAQGIADRLCSEARVTLKNYFNTFLLDTSKPYHHAKTVTD